MKRLLSLLIIACVAFISDVKAQVSFSPSSYTALDQVTLTVDVTGTPMAGQTDAYIWIFANPGGNGPTKDGIVNGSWTNSSADAKMVSAGTNKWSFTFTATTLFALTPGELNNFGFLVKAKDGSKQTPDYKPYFFDPLVFTPAKLRVFPAKVDADDIVNINYERTLGTTPDEQRMTPTTATITVSDNDGNQVGSPLTVPVKLNGTEVWTGYFIPSSSFTPPAGKKLAKFKFKFNGTILDPTGATVTVSTSEAEITFTTMK